MQISGSTRAKSGPRDARVIVISNHVSPVFSRELTRQEKKLLDFDRLELEDIKEELQHAGETFEKDPTIKNYRVFREMIGRFAKKAIAIAYRVESIPGNRPAWVHEVITIIDKAADELLRLVMEGQRDRLRIASKIASRKGMIVQICV